MNCRGNLQGLVQGLTDQGSHPSPPPTHLPPLARAATGLMDDHQARANGGVTERLAQDG